MKKKSQVAAYSQVIPGRGGAQKTPIPRRTLADSPGRKPLPLRPDMVYDQEVRSTIQIGLAQIHEWGEVWDGKPVALGSIGKYKGETLRAWFGEVSLIDFGFAKAYLSRSEYEPI